MGEQNSTKKYIVSVICAVYNVEPFLAQTINSILRQTIGFRKNIQLILVDDGSTDGSAAICDEYRERYPENITVIHKENGGVAAARNTGLEYATGKYLNFCDSDDMFDKNAFAEMVKFFDAHDREVDVVTVPLYFFDGLHGPHWLNDKFKKGTRAVDLFHEYASPLFFVTASLFRGSMKERICFDSSLPCGEDIKMISEILMDKMRLGVVNSTAYRYRRRSTGDSLIQTKGKKRSYYFDYFEALFGWLKEECGRRFGYVPAYFQNLMACEIQWRFTGDDSYKEALSEEDAAAYEALLTKELQDIDDKYLLACRMVPLESRIFMLTRKHGRLPDVTSRGTNVLINFENTHICYLSDLTLQIDRFEMRDGRLLVDGYTKIAGLPDDEPIEVLLCVGDTAVSLPLIERAELDTYSLGVRICRGIAFRGEADMSEFPPQGTFWIKLCIRGDLILKKRLRFSERVSLIPALKNSYYAADGYLFTLEGGRIKYKKTDLSEVRARRAALEREMWQSGKKPARKAVIARRAARFLAHFIRKPVWLLCDRFQKAGDNAEALALYLKKNRDVRSYFVIRPDSPDYSALRAQGVRVIPLYGKKHKLLHLIAGALVSSHTEHGFVYPFFENSPYYADLVADRPMIFLQHGVAISDVSRYYGRYTSPLTHAVVSARPEAEAFLGENYHLLPEQVLPIGLCRFDRLTDGKKKLIVFAPTWRAYLVGGMDQNTGIRRVKDGFEDSTYYREYTALLTDERLIGAAKEYGYEIAFVLHPNMTDTASRLHFDPAVKILPPTTEYRTIFSEAALLVTDYSSVASDFSYLEKPVAYFQADAEEFYSGRHTVGKSDFDYERDGFGGVYTEGGALVDFLVRSMETGCPEPDVYRDRVRAFFLHHDRENCARTVREIEKITADAKNGNSFFGK